MAKPSREQEKKIAEHIANRMREKTARHPRGSNFIDVVRNTTIRKGVPEEPKHKRG